MSNLTPLIFSFLRRAIGQNVSLPDHLSEKEAESLFSLSRAHDLSHLVAFSIAEGKVKTEGKAGKKLSQAYLPALYRYEQLNFETERILCVLEEEKIPHIPLKGARIRSFYPQPWMRTSCDIDILVHPEDLFRAASALTEKLGFTAAEKKNFHDLSLHSPKGIHLELHFNILEDVESLDKVLSLAWDYAEAEEGEYRYRFQNEFFLFHQIAHAAYHFLSGGCGIRPFLDLFLLKDALKYDGERLNELLKESELTLFYENALVLADAWFGDGDHTPVTLAMEEYLLGGGVFGTLENKVAMENAQEGKFRRGFERIFMPYKKLKTYYTVLERHPYLYPFYQVVRWGRILLGKGRTRAAKEFKANSNLSRTKEESIIFLKENLGLDDNAKKEEL